ncbi:PREDICTED: thioredoxin O1, mitochondrial isoform X2 [Tarenaya hassleriana]|uniref:thioredoxin O1, mitochondrial isoform X2 n=1 Tax=Tarenaya hassleriana TaxID=28532 RepID=UPI00053C1D37|nr:PREDICTED: thioredoxin O1, mitochondrial isoform X2 [Tarenaya hassleriana]
MKGNVSIFRQVLQRRFSTLRSPCSSSLSNSVRSLILAPNSISSQIARNSVFVASSIWASAEFNASNASLPVRRSFCSAAGDQPKVVVLKSEEEFKNALSKAQDGSLPSIFYFTAAWCGPCRFISPVIVELSEKYPDVTTYKVDIDEDGLSSTISNLNIAAVPTLHFFKEGAKKAEIVGADVAKLKQLMEQLYK